MEIEVTHEEKTFNRATRKYVKRKEVIGKVHVSPWIERKLREIAPKYRCSVADLVGLALSYYFGDGEDHLFCEFCEIGNSEWCGEFLYVNGLIEAMKSVQDEPGKETTVPVLD